MSVEGFITHLQDSKAYSENTILAYRNDLAQFDTFIKDKTLDTESVKVYIENLKQHEYASSTIARKVAAVKTYLHYLYTNQQHPEDLSHEIVTPKVNRRLQTLLTTEQVAQLMAVVLASETPKALRNRVLLSCLYRTNLRITELVNLELTQYADGKLVLDATEQREIILAAETRAFLEHYLREGRPELLKHHPTEAMFLNHRGSPLTRQGLWLIIREAAKRAGLAIPVTPHILRRSFEANQAGGDAQP